MTSIWIDILYSGALAVTVTIELHLKRKEGTTIWQQGPDFIGPAKDFLYHTYELA